MDDSTADAGRGASRVAHQSKQRKNRASANRHERRVDFAVEILAFQIYAYARLMSPFRHEDGVGKARQVQTSSPDV